MIPTRRLKEIRDLYLILALLLLNNNNRHMDSRRSDNSLTINNRLMDHKVTDNQCTDKDMDNQCTDSQCTDNSLCTNNKEADGSEGEDLECPWHLVLVADWQAGFLALHLRMIWANMNTKRVIKMVTTPRSVYDADVRYE